MPPTLRLRAGGDSAVVGFERRTDIESSGGALETPAGWKSLVAPLRNARAYAGQSGWPGIEEDTSRKKPRHLFTLQRWKIRNQDGNCCGFTSGGLHTIGLAGSGSPLPVSTPADHRGQRLTDPTTRDDCAQQCLGVTDCQFFGFSARLRLCSFCSVCATGDGVATSGTDT